MTLICNLCNYSTDDISNMNRHKRTNKHLSKVNEATIKLTLLPQNLPHLPQMLPFIKVNSELNKEGLVIEAPNNEVSDLDMEIEVSNPEIEISETNIPESKNKTSKSVINKNTKMSICNNCDSVFSHRSGLSRHKKLCLLTNKKTCDTKAETTLKEIQLMMEKKEMRLEMEKKDMLLEMEKLKVQCMREKIELLNSFKNIAENTAETSKNSCSALNYIIKHYNSAPCIQEFTKFELLTEKNENYSIAEIAIHKYNYNELCSYIGDIIVNEYKTKDPSKQALWSSDINRLTYMIREVTANNKVEWFTDKGGIKMAKYIVEPILNHINDDLTRYYAEKLDELDCEYTKESNKKQIRDNLTSMKSIEKMIDTDQLNDEIIRYIAKYLHLDRKNNIKVIGYDDIDDVD